LITFAAEPFACADFLAELDYSDALPAIDDCGCFDTRPGEVAALWGLAAQHVVAGQAIAVDYSISIPEMFHSPPPDTGRESGEVVRVISALNPPQVLTATTIMLAMFCQFGSLPST
jgi:hypothetical protein